MTIADIIGILIGLAEKVIPFLGALAFLFFIWGVAQYIKEGQNAKDKADAKQRLIWGVIGLFVMVSLWGIISLLTAEVGFGGSIGVPGIIIK